MSEQLDKGALEAALDAAETAFTGADILGISTRARAALKRAINAYNAHLSGTDSTGLVGWVLVPKEPTEKMITAGRITRMNIEGGYGGPSYWEAMLAAAPTPTGEGK